VETATDAGTMVRVRIPPLAAREITTSTAGRRPATTSARAARR